MAGRHERIPETISGIRQYQFLCLLALGAAFLVDLQQRVLLVSLLVLLIGAWGVLSKLRLGPILYLGALAAAQLAKQFAAERLGVPWRPPAAGLRVEDAVLSMAVLAYVAAHYRMQGLALNILPLDRRRRAGPPRWKLFPPPIIPQRRGQDLVTPREVGLFLIALPLWGLAGLLLWQGLEPVGPFVGLPIGLARLVVLGWAIGLGLILASALLAYWRHRQNSPAEAAQFLQDAFWQDTRGEQRTLNRWLAWRKLNQ
jgi:hypothetical protein